MRFWPCLHSRSKWQQSHITSRQRLQRGTSSPLMTPGRSKMKTLIWVRLYCPRIGCLKIHPNLSNKRTKQASESCNRTYRFYHKNCANHFNKDPLSVCSSRYLSSREIHPWSFCRFPRSTTEEDWGSLNSRAQKRCHCQRSGLYQGNKPKSKPQAGKTKLTLTSFSSRGLQSEDCPIYKTSNSEAERLKVSLSRDKHKVCLLWLSVLASWKGSKGNRRSSKLAVWKDSPLIKRACANPKNRSTSSTILLQKTEMSKKGRSLVRTAKRCN